MEDLGYVINEFYDLTIYSLHLRHISFAVFLCKHDLGTGQLRVPIKMEALPALQNTLPRLSDKSNLQIGYITFWCFTS